jgi:hypothetical protein
MATGTARSRSRQRRWRAPASALALALGLLASGGAARAQSVEPHCGAEQAQAFPQQFAGCAELQRQVENPAEFSGAQGLRLAEYEAVLGQFFEKYCHRDAAAGWVRDKRLRDTGPYVTLLQDDGTWADPEDYGAHQPVVIWYNARMLEWLRRNRPPPGSAPSGGAPGEPEAVPDGAVMVKEMYPAPAARCDRFAPEQLKPPGSTGVAFMVRDSRGARDGWFWGAWWDSFQPDWPARGTGLQAMGYGLYCLNCHASAQQGTFADLKNIAGFPGEPNRYLAQSFVFENRLADGAVTPKGAAAEPAPSAQFSDRARAAPERDLSFHRAVLANSARQQPLAAAQGYPPAFRARYPNPQPPDAHSVQALPSQTYDHVWMPAEGPSARSQFLTSDQCVGCHDAGSTGLQFDMTAPAPQQQALLNLSPYATWRSSPMGLAGRDPIFYAQLASEVETFHPERAAELQDICLGCHGVQGQRQLAIDSAERSGACAGMQREALAAIPYPSALPDNPGLPLARYGALARDGVACSACHHVALAPEQIEPVREAPQNRCVLERQAELNPEESGFARSFTGSFFVGSPAQLLGPFLDPRPRPMEHALGIEPRASESVRSAELCGSCHTVHLPIFGAGGTLLGRVYEQTTYPEWAFSAYRTGELPGGIRLPSGAGSLARSCQGCHMPASGADGAPLQSKIASIQELDGFPAAEHTLPAQDIDLPVRPGFARHTLVGLNVFLIRMARQFPALLGIPTQDPMLGGSGVDPLQLTEQAMLEQASSVSIELRDVRADRRTLSAQVRVASEIGHKFPSGVGFRRAFLEFSALDAQQRPLWTSGRTDAVGALIDERGESVAGEFLWRADCSARLPGTPHQPHYQVIRSQREVQIYQELVTAPAPVPQPVCGRDPSPGGAITTSFLSICGDLKDNRILPAGFLGERARRAIARALGAGPELAAAAGPFAVGGDPDYREGGTDSLRYEIPLAELPAAPAFVQATLYFQSIPPFYLQDRFCTSRSADTERLYYMAGHLDTSQPPVQDWKLPLASTGAVAVQP